MERPEYESESEYDVYDSESEYDDICYGPEDISKTRFNISICELYNKRLHGNPDNTDVLYHYLVYERYKILNIEYINSTIQYIKREYNGLSNKNHNIYRNYKQIINNPNYIRPEIIECIYLNTGHCIGIIKTFWIKLIQRRWKNVFKERKLCLSRRSNPNALKYREIYGKWPNNCLINPDLNGMLSKLSRTSS